MHFCTRHRVIVRIAALAMSGLAVVLHDPAVGQRDAGPIGHVEQALIVAMAAAVAGVVVEPVGIGSAAREDRAGEFAARGAFLEDEAAPGAAFCPGR